MSTSFLPNEAFAPSEEAGALRASDEKYRMLLHSIDEGFCLIEVLFDDDGRACDYRFSEANPAFEKHTGLTLEQSLGRTARELIPGHEEHWYEIYGRIARTGEPQRFEHAADALGYHYDVYAFRIGEPENYRVAVLFKDISERKRAEKALAAELHGMQVLRSLGERLVPQTDIQSLYEEVNAAAMELTSADAGAVRIFDPLTCDLVLLATRGFPLDFSQRFGRISAASATPCGEALATGKRTLLDFDDASLVDSQGELRWHINAGYFSAQSTPLVTRSGKPIGMISTHWRTRSRRLSERENRHLDLLARQAADLIQQRRAFEEIQEARAEAIRASGAKDHFLAVLSHELRTPLSPVLLALDDIINNEPSLPDSIRSDLAIAMRNVELEVRLIDDLLDITRIHRGKLDISREPTDVHETVRKALMGCQADAEAKMQRVELELKAASYQLEGDPLRLQQVFWNIFKNACKFTPPGGSFKIISRNPNPSQIEIEISDTGVGIEKEALQKIFMPFAQADQQVARKYGGLGLGLAIAKSVVEAHGGNLAATSEGLGKGTVFTVTLPVFPAWNF